MTTDIYDKQARLLTAAIAKAIMRVELLPYMRKQLLENITNNLTNMTDEEVENYLHEARIINSYESKKET